MEYEDIEEWKQYLTEVEEDTLIIIKDVFN